MIVFNSMLFLIIMLLFIYKIQKESNPIYRKRPIPWTYAIISMGYITFWAALRSGFIDTSAYIRMFEEAGTGIRTAIEALHGEKSIGFDFIMTLFKTYISKDFHYWLSFIALATAIPIMITYRRYSNNYLYCMFLFITSTLFIWMFNGIRQFLVAAIIFSFTHLIENRKMLTYMAVVLLCSTIHTTAIIMLPMYFFVTDKPFGKRMLLFILFTLSCAITITPLIDSMETVLQSTAYSSNLEQFAEDDGVHPLRFLLSAIPVILAFIKRKSIAKKNDYLTNICINMATISAGLYFIGIFTSGIMIGRLPAYFSLYSILLIPLLISQEYKKHQLLFYSGFSMIYIVYYFIMASKFYYISDILGTYH